MAEQVTLNCQKDQPIQVGEFGCNGTDPQTSYVLGAAVATTGATNSSPYGFTTAAQADALVTAVNNILAALKANGIGVTA